MVCIMNKVYSIQCEMWTHQFVVIYLFYFYFFFISFAKKTNKQTNKQRDKQKERWQGHRNSCGQLQRARLLFLNIRAFRSTKLLH